MVGWLLGFYDSTRDKDDTTVGVGHSRRYCNTGYDQSQGRRPSTLKCIGPISKGDIEPNHPSEINPNSDSRSRNDGRSRRFVQYRVDQSQGQRPRSLFSPSHQLGEITCCDISYLPARKSGSRNNLTLLMNSKSHNIHTWYPAHIYVYQAFQRFCANLKVGLNIRGSEPPIPGDASAIYKSQ